MKKKRAVLERLYRQHGWPDHWRREEFLATWRVVERKLEADYRAEVNYQN